jgi:hypothetical protein
MPTAKPAVRFSIQAVKQVRGAAPGVPVKTSLVAGDKKAARPPTIL